MVSVKETKVLAVRYFSRSMFSYRMLENTMNLNTPLFTGALTAHNEGPEAGGI